MTMARTCLVSLTVTSALMWGCGEEGANAPQADAPIVRPAKVETLGLDLSEQALPQELRGADLNIAQSLTLGTAAGGLSGFFVLGQGGFEQVDSVAVNAIVSLEGVGFLLGRQDGLRIWDGSMKGTSLDDTIQDSSVTALAARQDEVWIATATTVFLFDGDELFSFEIDGVTSIDTFDLSQDVLLGGATLRILRADDDQWTLADLDEEPVEGALPAAGGRIVGLQQGALIERVDASDGQVAWRNVSLSSSDDDQGARDVEAMASDPETGDLWIATDAEIVKLSGETVFKTDKPEGMEAVVKATVSSDGEVWLSDGANLWSAGSDGSIITFAQHIAPFSAENCERCHQTENGVGHPIVSYEQWSSEADEILNQLETEAMPADGRTLVGGSADLVRRWIEGGLQE